MGRSHWSSVTHWGTTRARRGALGARDDSEGENKERERGEGERGGGISVVRPSEDNV